MKTSSIANARTNLPQLIYSLESEEAIHLTRHGRPVAVMLSEASYQKLTQKIGLYVAIEKWRDNDLKEEIAFTDDELMSLRQVNAEREFSWDS